MQECSSLPTVWTSPTLIRYLFSNSTSFMMKFKAAEYRTVLKVTLWLGVFSAGMFLNQSLSAAVTFTNTPAAVSNTYTGTISLQVGGLTNTETVVIQKFLDANTNGLIDGADLLVQQF